MKRVRKYWLVLSTLLAVAWIAEPALSQTDTNDNTTPPPLAPSYQTDDQAEQGPSSLLGQLSYLEFRVFARTYPNEDVEKRLDRLERVVYGSRKTADVDQRVSALMRDVSNSQYAAGVTSGTQQASSEEGNASSQDLSASAQPTSLLDVISSMEKEVFGRKYPQDKLLDRVARLEKTVLPSGSEQNFTPLATRIHNLLIALQPAIKAPASSSPSSSYFQPQANSSSSFFRPTTNTQDASPTFSYPEPSGATEADNATEKSNSDGHPIIKKLGKILAGVGTVAGEAIGSMAYGSTLGYGAYGWGYPGYYPGYLGGWSGYGYGMPYGYGYNRWW